jgi:large subunit ribosomal protein L9
MKIILLKDVLGLGKIHEVVETKDGYAKNYLIKNKLAVAYTENSQSKLSNDLANLAQQEAIKIKEGNELKQQLEKISLSFSLKTNNGHTFGSVSNKAILDQLLTLHHIKIDKYMMSENKIGLGLGRHIMQINIYKGIIATLKIDIKEA